MLEKLIFFVEEYSMEEALDVLLPGMLDGVDYQIIRFQCKDDLLKKLPARLKGYNAWMPDTWSILVLVDRDVDDCMILKQQLEQSAQDAGFLTRTRARAGERFKVTNRIVIEELESWYFGDWTAVKTAYPRVSATIPQNAPYRNPDDIQGGTWEALERILKRAGYFSGGLRKAECARQVAQYMVINQNRSLSFNKFYGAVQSIVSGAMA